MPRKTLPKWVEWTIIIGIILYSGVIMYYSKTHSPKVKEIEFTGIGEIVPINNDQTITELQVKQR